jgi:PAS domain S-box-containing protein
MGKNKPTYNELNDEVKKQKGEPELKENSGDPVNIPLMFSQHHDFAKTILDLSTSGIYIQDINHRYVWVNKAAVANTKLPFDQLIGKFCYDVWEQQDHPCHDCPLEKSMKTGKPEEQDRTTPDGRHWLVKGIPIKDNSGEIINILEITDDISIRKVREINLEESEIRFRNLAESTPIGVLIYQGEFYVYANPASQKITGFKAKELFKMHYWDLVDKEHRSLIIDRGRKRLAGEEVPSEYRFQIRTKKGELKWVLINGCRIEYRGKPAGMLTLADITEHKLAEDLLEENEEKYRALSDASFEAIFISEKGICLEQNEMARQMFGYTDEEAIGRNGTEWIVPEDRDLVMKHMVSGHEKPYEVSALRKDGSTFPCLIQARMMHYQDRNVRVTSLRDISEQKLANNILLARLHLSEYATSHSHDELLTKTLDEAELLTGSQIGFYHFLEADQQTISLQAWSTNTLTHLCTAEAKGQHYDIDKAGVWVDCVRQGKPVIHNDYAGLPHRKGMPEGHAAVTRELVVPVFRGSKIVAILGVGNKLRDYDSNDVEIVSKMADVAWDIAEHKKAEDALKLSEDRYRKAFATSPDSIAITRATDGVFVSVNEGFLQITGYTREEVIGKSSLEINIWKDPADRQKVIDGLKTNGEVRNYEAKFLTKNGQITGLMSASIIELNGVSHILNITRDISDRKRAEEKIDRLNRTYSVLSNINQAIVRIHDMQSLWDEICRLSVEYGKFQMAWIGIVNAETKKVEIVASASQVDNPLEKMEIEIGKESDSVCHTATAILSGAHLVCNDIEKQDGKYPWRDIALKSGYKSLMSLPLTVFGNIFGAFSLFSNEIDFFDEDEIKLLDELGTDISFAIEFIENDYKRKEGETALLEERGLFIGGATVVFKWQEKEGWPVEYVSPNVFSQFGYSDKDFISGKILFESIVHPDDLERVRNEVNQYTQSGILSFEQEYRIVRPDGNYRWLYDFTVAKRNDEGIITHYHGYVHDITERKQANDVLKESEKRYRNLFETSPSGILLLDETGMIIEANDAITKSTLFSHEELIGSNVTMLTLPEEHQLVKENIRKILSGQVLDQEVGTMRKDGTHCIFMLRETAVTLPNGKRGILSVSNDITDHKKAEEAVRQAEKRYKALIEKAPDGIVMISDGKFKYSSPSAYIMFGYKKEDLVNLDPNELTHPDDRPMVLETLAKIIEDPSLVPTIQYRFLHKNGNWRWIESTFSNLNDEPAVNAIVINFRDITESKQAETDLRNSEYNYRSIMDQASDGILIVDQKGKNVDANQAVCKMLGYSRKELLKLSIHDIIHPDDLVDNPINYDEFKSGKNVFKERILIRKDASNFPVEISAKMMEDGRILGIIRDVADRRLAEMTLRNSEERYRGLFENMLNGFAYCKMIHENGHPVDFVYVSVNKAFEHLTGLKNVIGRCVTEVIPGIRESDPEIFNIYSKVSLTGTPQSFETYVKALDSWFSISVYSPKKEYFVAVFDVITQRKKAEDALKHSELQYRTLFEAANDAIFLMSEDKFIECNEMTLTMFGCNKKSDIINHHPWEFSPPDQPDGQKSTERATKYISSALKGKPQRFYWKHTRLNGQEFDAEVSLNLLQLEKDSFLQAIVRDITISKQAEEALSESEARYRLLADHMTDTVWLMDMDLKTIYISPSVEKLRGYSLKEIQEMSLDKHLTKESLWKALAIFSEEIEKIKVDPSYSFIRNIELEFLKRDGTTVWLESSFSVIRDEAGNPVSILGEGRDITERKKIELDKERDRQIQKTLNEILRLSTGGNSLDEYLDQVLRLMLSAPFLKVQQKGCIFLSDVHKEVLILKSNYNLPATLQTMCKNVPFGYCLCGRAASERKIQFSDGTSESHENNYPDNTPHGHYCIPIITDDIVLGVILIYLPVAHPKEQYEVDFYQAVADILCGVIQRKYTEEALLKAKERAEASDKLKTAFLNNISHELRTPLNGILGFAEFIIQEELTDEDKKEYFGILNDNSERLLSTVTNYMDTSLIASGNMEVKHARFNVNQLVLSLDEKYQPHCTKKNLELQIQLPANTGNFSITTDQELIRKILILLLDNAVKFTSNGSIAFGYENKPGEIKFFIKDTGIGIPKEARERVFERFIQGEVSNTRGYEGSGLGLFLAKGMVELLGGNIHVESVLDKGSTFYFTIPVEDGSQNIPDKSSSKITRSEKKNPTILIAEDDHYNYLFLETVLRTTSVRILHAVNGVEAIDMCTRYPEISLVLMDIKMPVMNGLEATKRIKATRSDLPIIAVTAYALSSDESLARKSGCDDYLAKPLTKDQLFEKINKYIVI